MIKKNQQLQYMNTGIPLSDILQHRMAYSIVVWVAVTFRRNEG